MFIHRVKSGTGLSLPQGAQEGVAAIYTHTKKSSHSNSLRASLDDEINPSFRPGTPYPHHLRLPPNPQPPSFNCSLESHADIPGPPRRVSLALHPQGTSCPLPLCFSLSHLVSHLVTMPSTGLPHRDAEAAGQSQLGPFNKQDTEATSTHPRGQRGRPGTPQAFHAHVLPLLPREKPEGPGKGRGGPSLLHFYTPLPGPHAAKLLMEGRELPRPLQPGEQHFRMEGFLTPRGCPRVTPQRPHAWAQPEGRDRATRAWALGLAPHAPPAAATNPEGSAVSLRPSQTCLQKPGRALLSPSIPAGLCSPAAPHHCPPRPQTGPSSLRPGAVSFAGTGTQLKETEETHFI